MGERGDQVSIAPYCLDLTPVTADAYGACVRSGQCSVEGLRCGDTATYGASGKGNHPVNCVDWGQAATYCNVTGKRLPTEEEWEWAARGGDNGWTYPWGNAEPDFQLCWSGITRRSGTCAVGSFPQGNNPWGVQDLAGNVWEWTASKPFADSVFRVTRGGGWHDSGPLLVRASSRSDGFEPSFRRSRFVSGLGLLGFRCARTQ